MDAAAGKERMIMKCTSAEAAKLLRKLNEDYEALCIHEEQSKEFLAASGEDIESVRPAYDYESVQARMDELEAKIRKVKHTINIFNATHIVTGFDMTIDQMLVYIPQLTNRKRKLSIMRNKLPKTRDHASTAGRMGIIDYRYTNYDIEKADADYTAVSELLAKAQTALDVVNNTETMELDL